MYCKLNLQYIYSLSFSDNFFSSSKLIEGPKSWWLFHSVASRGLIGDLYKFVEETLLTCAYFQAESYFLFHLLLHFFSLCLLISLWKTVTHNALHTLITIPMCPQRHDATCSQPPIGRQTRSEGENDSDAVLTLCSLIWWGSNSQVNVTAALWRCLLFPFDHLSLLIKLASRWAATNAPNLQRQREAFCCRTKHFKYRFFFSIFLLIFKSWALR